MTDTPWNLNASATGHRSYGVVIPSAAARAMQDAQREHDRLTAKLHAANHPDPSTRLRGASPRTKATCYGCGRKQVKLPNTRCPDCR